MNFYHADDIPEDLREYMKPAPQIGLEASPDAFVAKLVEVFREVRRVLRDDGTVWLNLGDSYANGARNRTEQHATKASTLIGGKASQVASIVQPAKMGEGLKRKDLIGIPWRVAFALQADGWYLRQDIIWHKPNPMPESVRDRCTKAHEYIFLLSKSERYYFDSEAIAEKATTAAPHKHWTEREHDQSFLANKQANGVKGRPVGVAGYRAPGERNRRSVWTVATKPYKGAHFATFPPDLIRPCILAGCPKDGTVLDPFGGSGTTALVALEEGRKAVLCELNSDYIALAHKRLEGLQLRIA